MLHKLNYITQRLSVRTDMVVIALLSFLFSASLLLTPGIPTTFDGPTHITTWHQVAQVLQEDPGLVTWLNNFGNYGSPIPIFAHQTTMYLGALIDLITGSATFAFEVIVFLGTIIGGTGLYMFLKIHVGRYPALFGSILFTFAPYKIMNIFSRGALPEHLALALVPWILFAMHNLQSKPNKINFATMTILLALLPLTHIFAVVVYSPIFVGYFFYLQVKKRSTKTYVYWMLLSALIAIGLSFYYVFPLLTETEYLHYANEVDYIKPGHSLNIWDNFVTEKWTRPQSDTSGPQAQIPQSGSVEFVLFVCGLILSVFFIVKKPWRKHSLLVIFSILGIVYIVSQLSISFRFFEVVPFIGKIQHQWRMMAGFSIIVPVVASLLVAQYKRYWYIWLGVLMIMFVIRTPHLNGRNYTDYPNSHYDFVVENLHGNSMTTVWAEETTRYPVKREQVEMIEGKGVISSKVFKNSLRAYSISAFTDVRIVDYTFYFPGWNVYIEDGTKMLPIEFQDPNYRGVITYRLPQGDHFVITAFEPTRKRLFAYTLSGLTLGAFILFLKFGKVSR